MYHEHLCSFFLGFLSGVCGAVLVVYNVISIKEPGFTLLLYSNLKSLKLGPTLWNSVPIFSCRSLIHYNVWKIQGHVKPELLSFQLNVVVSSDKFLSEVYIVACMILLQHDHLLSMVTFLLHFCRSFTTVRVSPVPVGFNWCVYVAFSVHVYFVYRILCLTRLCYQLFCEFYLTCIKHSGNAPHHNLKRMDADLD